MSVRSVDMQTMLPRLTEAARQQHNTDNQPFAAQHSASQEAAQRAVRQQQQVNHKPSADRADIDRERERGRKKGGERKRSGGGNSRNRETASSNSQEGAGTRLDVKV